MPTGRVRKGRAKVAGVTSEEALETLKVFQRRRGLPTVSRALGVLLEEWHSTAADGVLPHERVGEGLATRPALAGVLPAPNARGGAIPPGVRLEPLKEFARTRLQQDHPLRDVLLAEADTLSPEEFLAKLPMWCVLVSRKA